MHRFRTLALGGAVAALAVSALGAPVGAAVKADFALVNGIPGKKVDICINGNEVRSGVKYGGKYYKKVKGGTKTVKFRAKHPGQCKGIVLAKKVLTVTAGDDKTLVATKRKPKKVVVFDNLSLGIAPALSDVGLAYRHAADVGTVGFTIAFDMVKPDIWQHAGDAFWDKGDEWTDAPFLDFEQYVSMLWVVLPASEFAYAGPHFTHVSSGYRYQWIFVGSNANNAKILTLRQRIDI